MKWDFIRRRLPLVGLAAALEVFPAAAESRRLSLEQALAIALERNPDMIEAQSRLEESDSRLRAAQAGGWPTIKVRGAADFWSEDQRLFPATRNGEPGAFGSQTVGAELVATYPLYTGGRISGEIEVARWNQTAAQAQWSRAREFLAFQVIAQFFELLAQQEVLRSLEAAVAAMEEQARNIQALVDVGKAARVDLLRANVRRAELYELQVRQRNLRTVQQRAWAVLLGLDDAEAPEAEGTLDLEESPPCMAVSECLEKALSLRSDYQAAQAAVFAADAAIRAARAGFRPTVSLQASYGARWMPSPTERPPGTEALADVGRVGLMVEFPLLDGGLTQAKVAEQQARLRGAQERLRKIELQIRFELETALSELAAARERIKTAEQAIVQAQESFRITKEKYELGKGTMTDVLDAQTALVSAETRHARALADSAVAEARRKLAIGAMGP